VFHAKRKKFARIGGGDAKFKKGHAHYGPDGRLAAKKRRDDPGNHGYV
jgi:hypothetical protein